MNRSEFKDRNGRIIQEGDIIVCIFKYAEHFRPKEKVYFENGRFIVRSLDKDYDGGYSFLHHLHLKDYEIYED